MTTVRMSSKVVDKIRENSANAFIKTNPMKLYEETLGDRIYDFTLVNVVPIFEQISNLHEIDSNEVLETSSNIAVDISGVDLGDYPDPSRIDFTYNPSIGSHYSYVSIPLSSERTFFRRHANVELPQVSDLGNELLEILEYNKDIREKLKDHMEKIQSIINSCVTVNQFIKAWPAGASLVPEEALRKANERSVRKQAAEDRRALVEGMETDLNTSILTSSLLD